MKFFSDHLIKCSNFCAILITIVTYLGKYLIIFPHTLLHILIQKYKIILFVDEKEFRNLIKII